MTDASRGPWRARIHAGALVAVLAMAWAGCSESPAEKPADAAPRDAAPAALPIDAAPPDAAPPPFGDNVRSLELKRSIAVRIHPTETSELYGTIAAGTRVGWKQVIEGQDCDKRWVEIKPYGWICEVYLRPSERLPRGVEVPRLEREEIVPGVYGKVIDEEPKVFRRDGEEMIEDRALDGSIMVRKYGEHTDVEEIPYWRIDRRKPEYLPAESLREFRPSVWSGVRLGDDTGVTLPVGFPLSRENVSKSVPVFRSATGGGRNGRAKGRTPVPVLEIARDESGAAIAYRIGEERWVRAEDMRLAEASAAPPYTGPAEKWLDLDLDRQVLVAYEGQTPVYTTLVSTGSKQYPTETGVYRIWIKFAETDMSDLAGESPYSVATVPWTQFYAKDLALHTSYWHDTFGSRRSHGCTNLSPVDARFLYFWTDPEVPPGWSMAKGTIERPGSLIRIRSKSDPEPVLQGYAERIHEARKARSGKAP